MPGCVSAATGSRRPHASGKSLGVRPSATMEQAETVGSFNVPAVRRSSTSAAPGFSQTSFGFFRAMAGRSFAPTAGGTYMLTRSSSEGTSSTLAYAGSPSTSLSFGFTGKTSKPLARYARTALLPNFARSREAPMTATRRGGMWARLVEAAASNCKARNCRARAFSPLHPASLPGASVSRSIGKRRVTRECRCKRLGQRCPRQRAGSPRSPTEHVSSSSAQRDFLR